MSTVVVYLHGFQSSPQSEKAQQTLAYLSRHHPDIDVHIPQLAPYPEVVKAQLLQLVGSLNGQELRFIGSSMGGFLSTWLVEQFGGKAVLINPAVRPFELFKDYLGEHENPYTGERFTLQEAHIDQLKAMYCETLQTPSRYKVLLQTGDETLDYRQAQEKYQGGELIIEQGGDHSFQDYARHLPDIMAFLEVTND
ncbi:YqiA/YcfP family alpha/beta fold hydrolase [Aestuariibacter salexigens]|uniref:YqiA/YcfP family alpha/beta fold hydrolase n=1 Tax=Aestuariibacter salexigens TaxID=226010 RepID=UPI00042015C1|nr:YqiA/YcfP family alpha/beta fold hydrolase [Aestuariibacter salexigens]